MNIDKLTQMVNDIAAYFAAEPDHQAAVKGVADHLHKFWDPVMRKQIIQHAHDGGAGLSPMGLEAVQLLASNLQQRKAG